jgi:hypothetical protein
MKQTGLIKRVIEALGLDDGLFKGKFTPSESKPLVKNLNGDAASGAWDFVKENAKPIASVGVGLLGQLNANNSQSQYLDYLKEKEQQNYNDSLAAINAYNAQLGQAGGHGPSAGNQAAEVAAMRQNEANRLKAAKRANKYSKNMYKNLLKMYEPYRQTADMLLPQMTQTYQNSLGLQNAMNAYVNSPAQVAKLDAPVPAYQVNVPLPDSVRLK